MPNQLQEVIETFQISEYVCQNHWQKGINNFKEALPLKPITFYKIVKCLSNYCYEY